MSTHLRLATVAVLIASFAVACSGHQNIPASNNLPSADRSTPASGGSFAGQYAGSFALTECGASKSGHFTFSGSGHASFLHLSTESGSMRDKRFGNRCVWSGSVTLRSSHRLRNSVTFSLGLNFGSRVDPCSNAVGFVVKRGTGKFANAAGNGTVTFTCNGSNYTDSWSGSLTF